MSLPTKEAPQVNLSCCQLNKFIGTQVAFLLLYSTGKVQCLPSPPCAHVQSIKNALCNLSPSVLKVVHRNVLSRALIHLLNGWSRRCSSRGGCSTTREATRHASGHPTCTLVQLGYDGIANFFQLLLLVLKFFLLSSLKIYRKKASALVVPLYTHTQRGLG